MKSTPIKNDLFRFSTLRNPQLIHPSNKKLGYIFHPKEKESHFLSSLSDAIELEDAHKKLQQQAKTFSALSKYDDLREINPDFYDFSAWLSQNRNALEFSVAEQKAGDLRTLTTAQINTIWDNLFFQTIERRHPHIRQVCIQLIIAQNFIANIQGGELQDKADAIITMPRAPEIPAAEKRLHLYIKRLANAKVVLPKIFRLRPIENIDPQESEYKTPVVDVAKKPDFSRLNTIHFNGISNARNKRLRDIKAELEREKRTMRRGNSSNEMAVWVKERGDNISADALKFLTLKVNDVNSIASAINKVQNNIRHESRRILGPERLARRSIAARGHLIRSDANDDFSYNLSFLYDELSVASSASAQLVAYLSINTVNLESYIKEADYSLEINGKKQKGSNVEIVKQTGKYLSLRLFPKKDLNIEKGAVFKFICRLVLGDGTELTINQTGSTSLENNNGSAVVKSDDKDETSLSAPIVVTAGVTSSNIELYGVNNVGVAVYRKVEQEVCCYVPGEVSRIENVLAREYKERHTRNFVSTETKTEEASEAEIENLSDTATSERNELRNEISRVLSQDKSTSLGASAGVSGKAWGMEVSAGAHAGFNSSNSSAVSDTAAKSYAQEVTERALERVIQKTSSKRTSRVLKEFEESNKHGFDNRAGDQHVTGVYRWVDVVYTNRLVNYGKRLTYDFMIPEPAAGYKHMLELIAEKEQNEGGEVTTTLKEPLAPNSPEIGITGPEVFEEGTYQGFARAYGVSIPAPKPFIDTISGGFSPPTQPEMKDQSYSFELMIPPEYEVVSADVNIDFQYKYSDGNKNTKFDLDIGDDGFKFPTSVGKEGGFRDYDETSDFEFTRPWVSTLPITVSCKNINHFGLNIVADLQWSSSVKEAWQNEAYDIVMRAYEAQLKEYNHALASLEAEQENVENSEEKSNHQQFNRSIEKREIKRICIEMLTKPFGFTMGHDFYTKGACSAKLKQKRFLEKYASHVKFFEQAFDWEVMAYLFYPYYWAKECSWKDILETDWAPDPIFQAFLQSGMSRVTVPVRPGFEDAVLHYMETGEIWQGGDLVMDTDDELYLSIAEELQQVEGVVEEEWQTRVPTTLTVVQADSVALQESGLPCCNDVSSAEDNPFKTNTDVMKSSKT